MSLKDDEFLKKLNAAFQVEAREHVQAIASGLLELEKTTDVRRRNDVIAEIFREAHSLKGAARAVNVGDVESLCQSLESVLAAWRRQHVTPTPELCDALHAT